MISDKTKMLCLIAFTVAASGCGERSDSSTGSSEITDPAIFIEDEVAAVNTTTEANIDPDNEGTAVDTTAVVNIEAPGVADSLEISDGFATPIPLMTSGQMDAFVENPLSTEVPSELNSGITTALSRNYITNPLVN